MQCTFRSNFNRVFCISLVELTCLLELCNGLLQAFDKSASYSSRQPCRIRKLLGVEGVVASKLKFLMSAEFLATTVRGDLKTTPTHD